MMSGPSNPDNIGINSNTAYRPLIDPCIGGKPSPNPGPPLQENVRSESMSRDQFNETRDRFAESSTGSGNKLPNSGSRNDEKCRGSYDSNGNANSGPTFKNNELGTTSDRTGPTEQGSTSKPPPPIIYKAVTQKLLTKLEEKEKYSAPFYIQGHSSQRWKLSPTELEWGWGNSSYVDLPLSSCFRKNMFQNGKQVESVPRWGIIEESLYRLKEYCQDSSHKNITVGKVIGDCVRVYNRKLVENCNFGVLNHRDIKKELVSALPLIVDRCLELPSLLSGPIPKLAKGRSHTLFLTRRLCCSLLANAFFCTIPHGPGSRDSNEIPHFHFLKLFHADDDMDRLKVKLEKNKCVFQYFREVSSKLNDPSLDSIVSFERRCIRRQVNWERSETKLCSVHVNSVGNIESAEGLLQVDFANKFVGGGILSNGMVQEEIRFGICPDLIVSRLFTEVLGDDEVLVVTGARQFSTYQGYGKSFEWVKMKESQRLARDELGREMVTLVAMDALHLKQDSKWIQYQKQKMDRELHKAFVAFKTSKGEQNLMEVATGNWGCGAFNGDPQLKALLQWMACTEAGRPGMVYYTMGDKQLSEELKMINKLLARRRLSVGGLYKLLEKYQTWNQRKSSILIFNFVKSNL